MNGCLDDRLAEAERQLRAFGVHDEADAVHEARQLLKANLTPGFICTSCSVFTGTAKEAHKVCRACGAPRP